MDNNNVLISGLSGLVGSALQRALTARGYTVYGLDRYDHTAPFYYDQQRDELRLADHIPLRAVINLAGASLADGRWSAKRKQVLYNSRILTTRSLADKLTTLSQPPACFLSASAMGYYGQTDTQPVNEHSPAGDDFLATIARDWEAATESAQAAGIRTVLLRFGLVLSSSGGVLPNFILPGRLAAVGRIGSGKQYLSWISLPDCINLILHLLEADDFTGPLNLVSNNEVSNSDFTARLATALNRPRLPPLPAPVVKLLFGEMGEATLLSSARVKSTRQAELGFTPAHAELDEAFSALL